MFFPSKNVLRKPSFKGFYISRVWLVDTRLGSTQNIFFANDSGPKASRPPNDILTQSCTEKAKEEEDGAIKRM